MYFVKTPSLISKSFPKAIWNIPTVKKEIYLTFDDGPIPDITPWVLDELKKYKAKATFFCVGNNIEKHSEIFQKIISEGHSIGNHTYNHLNGWKTKTKDYLENVSKCESAIQKIRNPKSEIRNLFRPPYGRIRPTQYSKLNTKYSIVMWDVLSGDFDKNISKEKCLRNVLKNYRNGSIVVFHDSIKAFPHLEFVLPGVLEYFFEKGFEFKSL